MTDTEIRVLLSLIKSAMDLPGPTWHQKRDAIFEEASEEDKTNLAEFASWFAEHDEWTEE